MATKRTSKPIKRSMPDMTVPPEVSANIIATGEWKRLATILDLTEIDLAILSFYCLAYATFQEARIKLATEGLTAKTGTGHVIPNVHLGIANTASKLCRAFAKELGLTPMARGELGGTTPDDDIDLPE